MQTGRFVSQEASSVGTQTKPGCRPQRLLSRATAAAAVETVASPAQKVDDLPLMLRTLRGDAVERPPVWMMRQAGRYMKVYQELCKKHKTFRERSENVELAVEISLQPWKAFAPDGVILFSDILTPFPGMNIPFDIVTGKGPIIHDPIRTMQQVQQVTPLVPEESVPFVGESLRVLRAEVGNAAALLGFVGAPYTLATYIIEGGSSKSFVHTKRLAFSQPEVLHALLDKLTDSITTYVRYQADAGAQVVQIFDSWAAQLSPEDFDVFAGPYIKKVIQGVKATHPDLPIILYISGSGGLLERMAACNPDVISIDGSVSMTDGIARIGHGLAVQGNMDPGVLFGSPEFISQRVVETVKAAQGRRHIMNLGHGILPGTPEVNAAHFFEVAKTIHERI